MSIATRPPSPTATTDWKKQVDEQLATLQQHKNEWAALPVSRRIAYLDEVRRRVHASAPRWVEAACQAKGLRMDAPAAGEEWSSGPWALIFGVNRYIESLRQIEKSGSTSVKPGDVRTRHDGQVVVKVYPETAIDNLLLNGVRAEIWMEPGVTAGNLAENMSGAYRKLPETGVVSLVLGAGNISSIAPMDVLHKMLAEHSVVLLKMNPVNDYLGPIFEDVFQLLVRDGFLAMTYGGPEVGEYITKHAGVEEIHMTGSDRTHDAIVWGTGPEAAERKQSGKPQNPRRMTSELGNVTPLIVVPGPWDAADVRFQAEHIVTTKVHNAGFNCIGTQVVVMPEKWDRADALLAAVREIMVKTPPRKAYYPGAAQRQQAIVESHGNAEMVDSRPENEVPRTLVTGLDSKDAAESCFRQECFVSALATTEVPGASPIEFLRNAVKFCNENLWGTLGATLLIHPATMKQMGPAFEDAIADLRYGTIGINIWCGVGFLLAETAWGAYPGHTLDDVQSGIGFVHNTKLFDRPQKSVIYGPFYPYPRSMFKGQMTMLPKPPWFVLHRHGHDVNRLFTSYEFDHKLGRIPGIFGAALRS
ncbi:MAG TPA: aldehyde dehydrogenase family protein [Candidatus Dormibacteraeota bacterium]|jgi:aldehyde dehydrogenase (NAD(P)+)